MKLRTRVLPLVLMIGAACVGSATAEVVKIAQIDPFTGPAAGINENNVHMLQYAISIANKEHWAGPNITFQDVPFDNKGTSQEAIAQLNNATDQGIHFVTQGLSSSIGLALSDAAAKFNERNPGKEVLYLTPTNTAPEITGERCNFWAFRFDSNQDMKVKALMTALAENKSIKKVYLINQNYAMGQQTSAAAKRELKVLRPDIEIVGDDLTPMLAVKDFSPYVAKIKASGAQAVVTANWSGDLTLLIKAAKDSALNVPFYTVNAATTGIPAALAAAQSENVKLVTYWVPNDDVKASAPLVDPFKAKYNDDFTNLPWYTLVRMLSQAIKDAGTTQPAAVAKALENVKIEAINGTVQMRAADHQIQQPLVIADWTKSDPKTAPYDLEKTGYGFKTTQRIPASEAELPSTCQMKRPG